MDASIRISPEPETAKGESVTFVLAIGSDRQSCRLKTTFDTQRQALSYLQKHRTELELIARTRLADGEIEEGIIHLKML